MSQTQEPQSLEQLGLVHPAWQPEPVAVVHLELLIGQSDRLREQLDSFREAAANGNVRGRLTDFDRLYLALGQLSEHVDRARAVALDVARNPA